MSPLGEAKRPDQASFPLVATKNSAGVAAAGARASCAGLATAGTSSRERIPNQEHFIMEIIVVWRNDSKYKGRALSSEKNCEVSVPVYDGKRRFDIIGHDAGTEYIDEEDYGVYTGEARLCDAGFKAVAGKWDEKLKERFWKKSSSGEDRDPFHVWLASIAPGMPEMAVRLETESAWGNIVMHLTKWRPAGPEDALLPSPKAKGTRQAALK